MEKSTPDMEYSLKEVRILLKDGQSLYSDAAIRTPQDAIDLIGREISRYDREVVCVLNMTTRAAPITFSKIDPRFHPANVNIAAMGTTNGALISAANILKSGILSNASAFILLHNHPSGEIEPSGHDYDITRTAVLAGKIMGIPCMDHIIVGGGTGKYFSFRDSGAVDFEPDVNEAFRAAERHLPYGEGKMVQESPEGLLPEDGAKSPSGTELIKISDEEYYRKYYERIGLHGDQAYEIKKGGETAGLLIMDECNPDTGEVVPYIEWIEINDAFRKRGLLKDTLSILLDNAPEISLSSSDKNISMYKHLGAKSTGFDAFTEMYSLTISKKDFERAYLSSLTENNHEAPMRTPAKKHHQGGKARTR